MNPEAVIPGTVLEDEVVDPIVPETAAPEVPAPTAPEAAPEPPVAPEGPVDPEVDPEATPAPSPREAKRIEALLEKLKGQTPNAPTATQAVPQAPTAAGGLDFRTGLDADPETIQQIEAEVDRRVAVARQQANATGTQAADTTLWKTRLEIDAPKIEAKYPKLDPQSEDFDASAAGLLNQSYLTITGYNASTGVPANPNLRYSDFIEGMMELADLLAGERTAVAAKTIARQAAQTGIRPTGAAAKGLNLNKQPKDMNDDELEAMIAMGVPTR